MAVQRARARVRCDAVRAGRVLLIASALACYSAGRVSWRRGETAGRGRETAAEGKRVCVRGRAGGVSAHKAEAWAWAWAWSWNGRRREAWERGDWTLQPGQLLGASKGPTEKASAGRMANNGDALLGAGACGTLRMATCVAEETGRVVYGGAAWTWKRSCTAMPSLCVLAVHAHTRTLGPLTLYRGNCLPNQETPRYLL
jgi:hypothetical protein